MKDEKERKPHKEDSMENILYLIGQAWELERMGENSGEHKFSDTFEKRQQRLLDQVDAGRS